MRSADGVTLLCGANVISPNMLDWDLHLARVPIGSASIGREDPIARQRDAADRMQDLVSHKVECLDVVIRIVRVVLDAQVLVRIIDAHDVVVARRY